MPAAAVIPAPIAYIKVVAVKKLVVEPLGVLIVAPVVVRAFIRLRTTFGLRWSV